MFRLVTWKKKSDTSWRFAKKQAPTAPRLKIWPTVLSRCEIAKCVNWEASSTRWIYLRYFRIWWVGFDWQRFALIHSLQRLELYDFPMDIQELSITLTSKRSANDVHIIENKKDLCSINTEDFLDQQEWDLFGHVTTSQKEIFDPWRKYERSAFSVTCFIARKPGYYLYK